MPLQLSEEQLLAKQQIAKKEKEIANLQAQLNNQKGELQMIDRRIDAVPCAPPCAHRDPPPPTLCDAHAASVAT